MRKAKLLRILEKSGCVRIACRAVNVTPRTFYNWQTEDEDFKEKAAEARALAAERLELEAYRRGVEGVKEPVYQGGKFVGYVRRYSDAMLKTLLVGAKPEKYGSRAGVSIYNQTNVQVNVDAANPAVDVSPERKAMLARIRSIILDAYPEAAARHDHPDNALAMIDQEASAGNGDA